MVAKAGFEPTTIRSTGIDSTKAPPRTTKCCLQTAFGQWFHELIVTVALLYFTFWRIDTDRCNKRAIGLLETTATNCPVQFKT